MPSRRAQRRAAQEFRDRRCQIAIVEVEGDASGCFEIMCATHDFWTHTTSGFESAELTALRHAMTMGQTLAREDIRQ